MHCTSFLSKVLTQAAEDESNYVRYSNESYHPRDRNAEMVSFGGQIYYATTKKIGNSEGNDEIFTCYSSQYKRDYPLFELDQDPNAYF